MNKDYSILDYIKGELNFSLILAILIYISFTIFSFDIVTMFDADAFGQIIGTIVLFIAPISILLTIKKNKWTLHHSCLTIFMLICICASASYIGSNKYYITYFRDHLFTYLFPAIAIWYISMPKKEYSKVMSNKIEIVRYFIIAFTIIINIINLTQGENSKISMHYNVLGAMNMILVMYSSRLLFKKNNILKIVGIALLALSFYMLVSSTSRASTLSALIYFALMLIALIIYKSKNKKVVIFSFIAVALIVLLGIILFQDQLISFLLRGRSIEGLDFNEKMNVILSGRWTLWTDRFMSTMKTNTLFGHGIRTLNMIVNQQNLFLDAQFQEHVFLHNAILDAIYSGGIIGFIYFFGSSLFFMIYVIKNLNNKSIEIIPTIMLLLTLSMYFLFDMYFIWNQGISFILFLEIAYLQNEVIKHE